MTRSMMVRPLTRLELQNKDFLKTLAGQHVVAFGRPMSIMGPSDHYRLAMQSIEIKLPADYWVQLRDLGFSDGPGAPAATGGRTVPILWGADFAFLRNAAIDLKIPAFDQNDLLYFESVFEDAFLDAFSYADQTQFEMHKNAFFLSRIFGFGVPNWNSKEANAIKEGVRKILAKAKR